MPKFALFLIFTSWAFIIQSNIESFVLLEHPKCGGVLIAPDKILTLQQCAGENKKILASSPDTILVIIGLDSSDSIQNFQIASIFREHMLFGLRLRDTVFLSGDKNSSINWIKSIEDNFIDVKFAVSPVLLGAPVWFTEIGPTRVQAVVGLMVSDRKAIRLEKYLNFIFPEREKKKSLIAIKAELLPSKPALIIEAKVKETLEPAKQDFQEDSREDFREDSREIAKELYIADPIDSSANNLENMAAIESLPESLGCACSQVRSAKRPNLTSVSLKGLGKWLEIVIARRSPKLA